MKFTDVLGPLWDSIRNIPAIIKKLKYLTAADGAVFLDADGNYRIVPFGSNAGEIAQGNHTHSQLSSLFLTSNSPSTSSTTGAFLLNGIGMGAGDINIEGNLYFGQATRQMINLWSERYAIGVQSLTTYFRSARNFAWFVGGKHSNITFNPGFEGQLILKFERDLNFFQFMTPVIMPGVTINDGNIRCNGRVHSENSFSGTFTSSDGKTIIVEGGTITEVN